MDKQKRKAIFLDIDGVVGTTRSYDTAMVQWIGAITGCYYYGTIFPEIRDELISKGYIISTLPNHEYSILQTNVISIKNTKESTNG